MTAMRIVSLLPTGTEILRALGAADAIVGLSHDHPDRTGLPDVPTLTRLAFNAADMSAAEIDAAVSGAAARNEALYSVDTETLVGLHPDLVITQELCQVCAITPSQMQSALGAIRPAPQVLTLGAGTLTAAEGDILKTAEAIGRPEAGAAVVADWRRRRAAIQARLAAAAPVPCPLVACLEWPDPIYNAGHWVPEMVEAAGGIDVLSKSGVYSVRIPWERVRDAAPEVVAIMACGLERERALSESHKLLDLPGFGDLPAARQRRVWVVDGPLYFSQAGPGLIDGIEILARLIHPDIFGAPTDDIAIPLD